MRTKLTPGWRGMTAQRSLGQTRTRSSGCEVRSGAAACTGRPWRRCPWQCPATVLPCAAKAEPAAISALTFDFAHLRSNNGLRVGRDKPPGHACVPLHPFWRHSSVGKDDRALPLRLKHYNKVAREHHMQAAQACAVCHGMCRMLLQHNEQLAGPRLVMRSSMSRLSGRGVDRSTRGMCARMQSSGEPS